MARNVGREVDEITFMLICTLFKFYLHAAGHTECFRNGPIDGDSSAFPVEIPILINVIEFYHLSSPKNPTILSR